MKYALTLLLSLLTSLAWGDTAYHQVSCDQLVPYGAPKSAIPTSDLCRISYRVQYFDACKAPLTSSELLLKENIDSGSEPRHPFLEDPQVPLESRGLLKDYVHSGYDKGHLSPAGDMRDSSAAMSQSFYLSNMVPQAPKMNRGIWRSIEMRTRRIAELHGELYVITGAIFDANPPRIGSGICVPTYMYKVLIDKAQGKSMAYLVPNTNEAGEKSISSYFVSVAQLEQVTGINFTPELDPASAAKLKTTISTFGQ
jgi:endonuclease G